MADAVTSKIHDVGGLVYGIFTNVSDGTGESAVKKLDASDQGADAFAIRRLKWSTKGMGVTILFDATTDDIAFNIPTDTTDEIVFEPPLRNPVSSGATGDINFTTVSHSSGDSYVIEAEFVKTALVA